MARLLAVQQEGRYGDWFVYFDGPHGLERDALEDLVEERLMADTGECKVKWAHSDPEMKVERPNGLSINTGTHRYYVGRGSVYRS